MESKCDKRSLFLPSAATSYVQRTFFEKAIRIQFQWREKEIENVSYFEHIVFDRPFRTNRIKLSRCRLIDNWFSTCTHFQIVTLLADCDGNLQTIRIAFGQMSSSSTSSVRTSAFSTITGWHIDRDDHNSQSVVSYLKWQQKKKRRN